MTVLTAAKRKSMPKSVFAGPGRSFPINDPEHARLAKSGASRALNVGNITASQKAKIDARADRMLNRLYGGRIRRQDGGQIVGAAAQPNLGRAQPRQIRGVDPRMFDPASSGGQTPPIPHHPTVGPFFGGRAMYT